MFIALLVFVLLVMFGWFRAGGLLVWVFGCGWVLLFVLTCVVAWFVVVCFLGFFCGFVCCLCLLYLLLLRVCVVVLIWCGLRLFPIVY